MSPSVAPAARGSRGSRASWGWAQPLPSPELGGWPFPSPPGCRVGCSARSVPVPAATRAPCPCASRCRRHHPVSVNIPARLPVPAAVRTPSPCVSRCRRHHPHPASVNLPVPPPAPCGAPRPGSEAPPPSPAPPLPTVRGGSAGRCCRARWDPPGLGKGNLFLHPAPSGEEPGVGAAPSWVPRR